MKIAIISHFFSPYSLIGAKRSTYMANYLYNSGDDITVLKASDSFYGSDIDKKKHEKPPYNIINISIDSKSTSFKEKNSKAWLQTYKEKIEKIVSEEEIAMLYFSGGPFFYFTLGPYFWKKFKIPYCLDFRDPWYLDKRQIRVDKGDIKRKLITLYKKKKLQFIESYVVKYATYIINVTPSITNLYKQQYHSLDQSKFITITNGYDDHELEYFKAEPNSTMEDSFNIGILGKFGYYNIQHVKELLFALKDLEQQQVKIKLYQWGEDISYIQEVATQYQVSQLVELKQPDDYLASLQFMSKMNCLVLNNRDKFSRGTKIYDYIFLNKPIIAFISKDSEIADFLLKFKNSFIVETKKDFLGAIRTILNNNLTYLDTDRDLARFSRKSSMKQLHHYLHS